MHESEFSAFWIILNGNSFILEFYAVCHMLMPMNWNPANTVESFHYTSVLFSYLVYIQHHVWLIRSRYLWSDF